MAVVLVMEKKNEKVSREMVVLPWQINNKSMFIRTSSSVLHQKNNVMQTLGFFIIIAISSYAGSNGNG